MKNSEIINKIVDEISFYVPLTKFQKRDIIKRTIEAYIDNMQKCLSSKNAFQIRGLGNLVPKDFKIGAKKNPFTGMPIKESVQTRVRFKPLLNLKKILKGVNNEV